MPDTTAELALDEGMALCLDAAAGRADLVRWLGAHPGLAGELARDVAAADQVGAWLAPLRADAAATVDYAEPAAPEFGDFELLGELGRGGMGVVYKARQKSLGRVVALKTILPSRAAAPAVVARLRFEAEAAARLDHPNIVPIYGAGEHAGMPFFIMKFVPGGTLAEQLDGVRPDLPAAAALVAKVARAVQYAHQRGVLHRDLKPSNILIAPGREPMVADFGLAKTMDAPGGVSSSGAVVGTAPYMSPEQARGEKGLTTAADVYSLGAILYETLTGRPPFRADSAYETIRQVIEQAPPAPRTLNAAAPPDLEAVCLRCLEKKPEDRYASAADLAADLERFSRGEAVSVRASGVVGQLVRAVRGRRENIGPPADPWVAVTAWTLAATVACHGSVFALVDAGAAVGWVWAVLATYFAAVALQRVRQAKRSRAFAPWERHTVTLWAGQMLCSVALAAALLPLSPGADAAGALAWYPPLAVVYALAMFVQGSIAWGTCFVGSFLYMALAVALRFAGPAAPLVFLAVHVPVTVFLVRGAVRPGPATRLEGPPAG